MRNVMLTHIHMRSNCHMRWDSKESIRSLYCHYTIHAERSCCEQ